MKYAVYFLAAESTKKPASREHPERTYRLVAARQSPDNSWMRAKQSTTMGAAVWPGGAAPPASIRTTGTETVAAVLKRAADYPAE